MQKIKPKRVLLLGSGALQIGQAGEFDYSGSQALKALREEGVPSVLINPNIATIQTDPGLADQVYFLPVDPYFVEQVLRKEKCDSLLLSFGGQTALNCGLALEESGVLERLGVRVLGTPVSTIRDTEDRHLFVKRLDEIQVRCATSEAVKAVPAALVAAKRIGYPVMIRSGFSLGGKGSSIVKNEAECEEVARIAFAQGVPQILVEECLSGWKEIEYEVVRDANDSCITVCNMENVDPMGIHTGESIVVAPSQTLDDYEYQLLRDVAIKTIRHLGIVGECNIQYALHPDKKGEYRVIEVNARLSRSSALASKATGYPLAYVAAKIALGYTLPEIPNQITRKTTAFFEPALDYVVCKIPRWDLEKFANVNPRIGSEMKSVGEIMAVGRSFPEALQKGLRMLEIGADGLSPDIYSFEDLETELAQPTPRRIFAVAQAFDRGMGLERIAELTRIDRFFLAEMERVSKLRKQIAGNTQPSKEEMLEWKQAGFADRAIATLWGRRSERDVRTMRQAQGIRPSLAQIDTLAAEYPAQTNFLYFTYGRTRSDVVSGSRKKVLVLGSGCYRIGSSVEFDWCAVGAVKEARALGYETLLLNCNPETVSTDYDTCDQLIFDEISVETVCELRDAENPEGVIVSMGGQTPNNLALKLSLEGVPILGTDPRQIDRAEDRKKFSALLDTMGIKQPKWAEATDLEDVERLVDALGGFPILVRPSYVLSGAAMKVAANLGDLRSYLKRAAEVSPEHPVVVTKFEEDAREVEFDGVADQGDIRLWALCEHIENAGVHSGDATLVIPPQRLPLDVIKEIRRVGISLSQELEITGPFNVQMLVKNHEILVIECNLRASRSLPFVSKAMGVNFAHEAARIILNPGKTRAHPKSKNDVPRFFDLGFVAVKAPQFSFSRLRGADPKTGVEMASTGEVACFGQDTEEALLKAMLATGFKVPKKAVLVQLMPGFKLDLKPHPLVSEIAVMKALGLTVQHCEDGGDDQWIDSMKRGEVDLVISLARESGYRIRRTASDLGISVLTDLWLAKRLIEAMRRYKVESLEVKPWSDYVRFEPEADQR